MNARKPQRIYFLAICGTAMASLAAMLQHMGYRVYGSDSGIYPPMSDFLATLGIEAFSGFDPAHLDPAPDLVVVGNVISRGNVEIEEILDRRIPYISLPDALREFCIRGHRSIVVTGTHGKTTTTSLIAWIFEQAGRDPNFLVGGIPNNFGRGFQVGKGEEIILEGDEYDSAYFDKAAKFLRYLPDIGVINHIEFDHADIYNNLEEILVAFRRFVNLIPRSGLLVSCADYETVRGVSERAFCPVESFGFSVEALWQPRDLVLTGTGIRFTVLHGGEALGEVEVDLLGDHNVRNVLAAIAVARHGGIAFSSIQAALKSFTGIRRRLEFKGEAGGVAIYDDFGHHPTAILETLRGFRRCHPDRRIWALFEPRSATTRRSVFQNEMATAFAEADAALIAPVDRPDKAPAGQLFSTETLAADLRRMGREAVAVASVDEMLTYLLSRIQPGDVVISFSNGPFGGIHDKLLTALKE
ncbi:MAG TPA: UDP-N-acetylmuramate:L-alanyl-gamma-D-glutamyl-meso-diaminopimelate ligase [bacterium]|nr:UDP-N-acetylmuramate:L-alanyl-gamma-D-glutamyl-meso-diaminopimelate ligase [bacterium]HQI47778.1 UDP-N-acetylmuramate:L-alanyl-gamma-D-glutamyl-meso-diaminopimelate ligase [bacterium]HQJ63208.1 UDP-N-acetylmuramate:L-alanyl-gamma-D-glutamyl-meso-diaminopimelate ligase [bacterium]